MSTCLHQMYLTVYLKKDEKEALRLIGDKSRQNKNKPQAELFLNVLGDAGLQQFWERKLGSVEGLPLQIPTGTLPMVRKPTAAGRVI